MTRPHSLTLAIGIVSLEFAAAVSTFVSSTLLPAIVRDLTARDEVELLIAARRSACSWHYPSQHGWSAGSDRAARWPSA